MIKIINTCEKCGKSSMPDEPSTLEINFKAKIIAFLCPKCGHPNIMDFGDIKSALDRMTQLPRVGGANF